ncbi:MAG: adenine phosphoribosyltransferase [Gammaproteobacteria bacterium]|nr:adenine phosphoribosyltransferase [Gammaproteobacteria bacterium]
MTLEQIRALIRDVPDFPKPGIVFKDITPLVAHPEAFRAAVDHLAERTEPYRPDALLAIESRGFIFGTALAQRLNVEMHLVRKRGKLPRQTVSAEYQLEYGTDHLEVHADSIRAGGRYLIVDDLIATGGTAAATASLVERHDAVVAAYAFLIELKFLDGRKALGDAPVVSLIEY